MSFNLIPTPSFERELKQLAKKYPSIKNDIAALASELLQNPKMGTPLGHDCYKIENIFLLAIYDKSEAESISDKDILARLKNL